MRYLVRWRGVAAALGACAVLAGPIAAAQASNATLLATIKSGFPKIIKSQAKILDGLATYDKTHSKTPLIKAIKTQNGVLKALEVRLSHGSPSSAQGARGKAEVIKGLGLIVGSNTTLVKHLQSGKSLSKAQSKAAVKAATKGNLDLSAGAKLLKG